MVPVPRFPTGVAQKTALTGLPTERELRDVQRWSTLGDIRQRQAMVVSPGIIYITKFNLYQYWAGYISFGRAGAIGGECRRY